MNWPTKALLLPCSSGSKLKKKRKRNETKAFCLFVCLMQQRGNFAGKTIRKLLLKCNNCNSAVNVLVMKIGFGSNSLPSSLQLFFLLMLAAFVFRSIHQKLDIDFVFFLFCSIVRLS